MPFALVMIGLIFIITGAQGTQKALGEQLAKDFTGPGNFTFWIVSLGVVGSLGYVESIRPLSRSFMFLIILAMVITNHKQGLFAKFTEALKQGPQASKAVNG